MRMRSVGWRRRRDAVVLGIGVVLVGLVALVAAAAGGPGERIERMWVGAELADGRTYVTEVIDYDFGGEERHGIRRDVTGTAAGQIRDVSVTADGESVPNKLENLGGATRIRIGDPDATVSGTHRYRITYTLPGLGDDRRLRWDAVGTQWGVPVDRAEVHVTAPFVLDDPRCVWGESGANDACTAEQPGRGRLDVAVDGLDAHEGVTLYAQGGATLAAAPLPAAPGGPAAGGEAGDSALLGWLWATGSALVAAVLVAELIRLVGRDRFQGPDGRTRRTDVRRLGAGVKPSPVPPAGLTPAQAGVLHADRVHNEHRVAWLLTAAQDGHLTIKGKTKPVLHRVTRDEADDPLTAEILKALFVRKQQLNLRRFNRDFAAAWKLLRERLDGWRRAGGDGLWHPSGEPRRRVALIAGLIAAVAGTVLLGIAATDVTEPGASWRTPTAVGAALAGAGLAAAIRAWELRSRTARGSQLWCETEAFRLHLAEPEGQAPDAFTPWAAALGHAEEWSAAVKKTAPRRSRSSAAAPADNDTLYRSAPFLSTATLAAESKPSGGGGSSSGSSSGGYSSGGGGGGGVGGGDGGGGGGSW
ncbi:DUF2207 domain-containing protein [Streptomyces sp. NPDC050658]|uniref:DUF2207 domain-containing protein n=1 Tax=unclassified Streptomyces TaxID=2593676 RepID=UPI00344A4B43